MTLFLFFVFQNCFSILGKSGGRTPYRWLRVLEEVPRVSMGGCQGYKDPDPVILSWGFSHALSWDPSKGGVEAERSLEREFNLSIICGCQHRRTAGKFLNCKPNVNRVLNFIITLCCLKQISVISSSYLFATYDGFFTVCLLRTDCYSTVTGDRSRLMFVSSD